MSNDVVIQLNFIIDEFAMKLWQQEYSMKNIWILKKKHCKLKAVLLEIFCIFYIVINFLL